VNSETFKKALTSFLSRERYVSVRAIGDSMIPSLNNGQAVRITSCKGKFVPGKCYVFENDGMLLLHRLVYYSAKRLLFMGDNSPGIQWTCPRNVVAEVLDEQPILLRVMVTVINLAFLVLMLFSGTKKTALFMRKNCLLKILRKDSHQ
jgi:hypothetical protein